MTCEIRALTTKAKVKPRTLARVIEEEYKRGELNIIKLTTVTLKQAEEQVKIV
jgi:lambda repressor-like predicted transcriptional regulator